MRVIGHRFSQESHDLRDFLARNRVPARWLDVERDGEARELLPVAGVDAERLPVALLEDGTVLERPTMLELAERLGVSGTPAQDHYDLVIVGGGPAGLAAAVYGASEGLRTVMVEREAPGGQAGQSSRIENYLGFPAGLQRLGPRAPRDRPGAAARRRAADRPGRRRRCASRAPARLVELSGGGALSANCVLVASGVSYRQLTRPGFAELTGAGVYYGAALTEARVVRRAARGRDRRRQLGRPGGRLLQRLRRPGDDARARRLAGEVDVALPDRADRGASRTSRCARGTQAVAAEGDDGRLTRAARSATRDGEETLEADACFVFIGAVAAHRLARRRRRARRARLHPRRPRRARARLAARSASPTRWRRASRRVRRRRRARALDQARRERRRRGLDGRLADPRVPGRARERAQPSHARASCARSTCSTSLDDEQLGRLGRRSRALRRVPAGDDPRRAGRGAAGPAAAARRARAGARRRRRRQSEPVGDHVAPTWIGAIAVAHRRPLGVRMQAETDCRVATDRARGLHRAGASQQPVIHPGDARRSRR